VLWDFSGSEKVTVPTTRLLLGGRLDALDEIFHGLKCKPRLPVVIFPSLGGLSDIMSKARETHVSMKHLRLSKRRFVLMIFPVLNNFRVVFFRIQSLSGINKIFIYCNIVK